MDLHTKHLVAQQMPAHLRASTPLFTKFLEYYYEFVQDSKIPDIIQEIRKYHDVDEVDAMFIREFYEEFKALPETLATDERFVAKYIYDLYKSKGSETSLKLLFKIVYGDDIRVRYPHQYILKASDGRWFQEKFVEIQFPADIDDFDYSLSGLLEFSNEYGTYSIPVTRFDLISNTKLRAYFKSYFSFTVDPSQTMTVKDRTGNNATTGTLVPCISKIKLVSSGTGWVQGQVLVVPGTVRDSIVRVFESTDDGTITKIETIEYGFAHNPATVITYTNPDAVIGFDTGWVGTTRGFYENDIGQISNPEIRLQDNKFYQQYSYVISTDVGIENFRDVIKLVHPAGTKYFSELTRVADFSITDFIDTYYTSSADTVYAQDVISIAEESYRNVMKSVSDSQTTSDAITSKAATLVKAETSTVTDTNAKLVTKQATGETVTYSDAKTLHATVAVFDESTTSSNITTKAVTKGVSDTSTIADAIASIVSTLFKQDTSTTSDAISSKEFGKTLNDVPTAVDVLVNSFTKVATETVSVTDALAKLITNSLADTSTTADTKIATPILVKSDTSTTADALESFSFVKFIADTVTPSDTILVAGEINVSLSDTVIVTDSATTISTFARSASETVTIVDDKVLILNKYNSETVTATHAAPVTSTLTYNSESYFAELYVSSETIIDID